MQPKIRVFELAKELNVDSKSVLAVLQTLNVDVKNHMSSVDQMTAEKVAEAVKRAPAAKGEGESAETAKRSKSAAASKQVKEANPAKTSLLEDFFGAGAKERKRAEVRKPEKDSSERPAAEIIPTAKVKADASAERKDSGERTETGAHDAAVAKDATVVDDARPSAPKDTGEPRTETTEPARRRGGTSGIGLPVPAKPGLGPIRPASEGPQSGPTPRGSSGIGLPVRPSPAERARIEAGPKPAGSRSGGSGIGLPIPAKYVQQRGVGRGPQPAGDRGPRPRGFDRGPRPGGSRPGFGRFGGRKGGGLTIPKVDPKVAEQAKPVENKRAQGGPKRRGPSFRRDTSRPSEEKLFGHRRSKRAKQPVRRELKPITIEGPMTVKELAHEMGVTAAEVIKSLLTGFGIMATINQELDTDTCVLVGNEFGIEVTVKEVESILDTYDRLDDSEEPDELKKPRPPVVTIMGHVDHGKTSLLDALRKSRVTAGEAGGITQHIGAYEVELRGRKIAFLDTPGHEAFTAMRARGANVTDVAVLVVAADDSVMPQTIESINHAKAAEVPIVVAINKIDKPQANPDKVKQDLTAHGLVSEEWGGDTIMVPVSAKEGTNLDLLLENILLLAEVLELKANPDKEAQGTILEAKLDKTRGSVATVLVQAGTLKHGDTFVAGDAWGRVRAMFDHRGRSIKTAGPSTPVQILGFQSVPSAGDIFRVTPDEKTARGIAEKRQARAQAERLGIKAMSLDDFMNKVAEGEVKDLNLIIKADVQGSVEALRGQLEKLHNEEVQVKIVHGAVGAVTETDVNLASASNAIIIGFNVRPDDRAARAASEQGVDIRTYSVIYDIVEDIEAAMTGMLAPKIEENILGRAEVRETFKVPKAGVAAGCMVISGKVTRSAKYRLIRDGVVVWDGNLHGLRRFKDEAKEVPSGYECGITLENYQDFKPGDILEAYEMKEVKAG